MYTVKECNYDKEPNKPSIMQTSKTGKETNDTQHVRREKEDGITVSATEQIMKRRLAAESISEAAEIRGRIWIRVEARR